MDDPSTDKSSMPQLNDRAGGRTWLTAKARFRYAQFRRRPPAGLHQLDQLIHELQFRWRSLGGHPPLIVYQAGKVGSSTLTESLKTAQSDHPVYQLHFLSNETIAEFEKSGARVWAAKFLRRRLEKGVGAKKWKVVTLVREPISRNISGFFYNMNYFKYREEHGSDTLSYLENLFIRNFDHEVILDWFDREMYPVFGLDIYKESFPRDIGWAIYETDVAEVLVLKLEKLDDVLSEAFSAFLGLSDFELVDTNRAAEKPYYEAYQEFRRNIRIPKAHLNKMYDSKYARHFYTDDELAHLREKWSGASQVAAKKA